MTPISRTNSAGGFTLIELLVVLVILGILAGVAVPKFGNPRAENVDTIAAELSSRLRALRQTAMTRGDMQMAEPAEITAGLPADLVLVPDPQSGGLVAEQIAFYPIGNSSGGHWQIEFEGQRAAIAVDWLTGRIGRADAE